MTINGMSPVASSATVAALVVAFPVTAPCLHAKALDEVTTITPYQSLELGAIVATVVVNVAPDTLTNLPSLRTLPAAT